GGAGSARPDGSRDGPPGTGAGPTPPRTVPAPPSSPTGGPPGGPVRRSDRGPPSTPPAPPVAGPPGRLRPPPHRYRRPGATGTSSLRDSYEVDCIRTMESYRRPCNGSSSAVHTGRTGRGLGAAPHLRGAPRDDLDAVMCSCQ